MILETRALEFDHSLMTTEALGHQNEGSPMATVASQFRGIPMDSMLTTLTDWVYNGRTTDAKRVMGDYDKAASDPNFRRFVRSLYPTHQLLDRCGDEYLCALFPAPRQQQNREFDAATRFDGELLGELDRRAISDSELAGSQAYRDYTWALDATDKQEGVDDGWKFCLDAIDTVSPIRLRCRIGKYFQGHATCDALKLEIQKAWMDSDGQIASETDPFRLLPYRRKLHELGDPIRSPAGRAAMMAISTLICFPTDTGHKALLLQRSAAKLALDKRRLHVIPAAMFEPSAVDNALPYSVYENVIREVGEECFNLRVPKENQDPQWYKRHYACQELMEVLTQDRASLHVIGLATNLLNLRPEVCTLLMIWDSAWGEPWVNSMSINWEYAESQDGGRRGERPCIESADHELINAHDLRPHNMVPPGAAAFWLGIDLARELKSAGGPASRSDRKTPVSEIAISSEKHFYVLRTAREEKPKEELLPSSQIAGIVKRGEFDLVIDEREAPSNRIAVKNQGPRELAPRIRKLLWVVLCRWATKSMRYDDASPHLTRGTKNASLQEAKSKLNKALVLELLLEADRGGCEYSINQRVSFVWIREMKEREGSWLLSRPTAGV